MFANNGCFLFVLFISILVSCFVEMNGHRRLKDKGSAILTLSQEDLHSFMELGLNSIQKQERFEMALVESDIVVKNGTLSHVQLLDSITNEHAQQVSDVAEKMLKICAYIYNSRCAPNGVDAASCQRVLSETPIPRDHELSSECRNILRSNRNGSDAFRRLLPRNYRDGVHEMFSPYSRPSAVQVSHHLQNVAGTSKPSSLLDNRLNLGLIQWTQFIEHDLSRPGVTTMKNGASIECCNTYNHRLHPRYHHPACAPLMYNNPAQPLGREYCLNYVRSAVTVGSQCHFGSVEEMNQVTGELDLSQLYGSTRAEQERMRAYYNGYLAIANDAAHLHQTLLPIVMTKLHNYCALVNSSSSRTCFMAGDPRVNSNPLTIIVYTIFQRNHNRIADLIRKHKPSLKDEEIFQAARKQNIRIYRQIVFNEWLPLVIGQNAYLRTVKKSASASALNSQQRQITNEFGVAASRFYYSMIPDVLGANGTSTGIRWREQAYRPSVIKTAEGLTDTLRTLLLQSAMKIDINYVDSIRTNIGDNGSVRNHDALAFDIQRGRDHGLQSYIKYIEYCEHMPIAKWNDLSQYIEMKDINRLRAIYNDMNHIDLMIGGLLEVPVNGAIVGPTFSCIISEQFSQLMTWARFDDERDHHLLELGLTNMQSISAHELICSNSDLDAAPSHVFELPSVSNPLKSCSGEMGPFVSTHDYSASLRIPLK